MIQQVYLCGEFLKKKKNWCSKDTYIKIFMSILKIFPKAVPIVFSYRSLFTRALWLSVLLNTPNLKIYVLL